MLRRSLALAIAALVFLVLPLAVSGTLRNAAVHAAAPLTTFLSAQRLAVSQFFTNLSQVGTLRGERAQLQEEIAVLQQQLSELESAKRENEALRAELGVAGNSRELPKVLANVVLQGTDPLDRTFTVTSGRTAGIRVGQPAVSRGYLIGRVIEVREHSAVVRSILSPQSIVQAWLPTLGEKGLLVGDGNTVSLQKLAQGVEIPGSALIETSGLGETLPQGLLIGTVGTALSRPSDLSQTFRVDLAADPSTATTVFILLTDDSP